MPRELSDGALPTHRKKHTQSFAEQPYYTCSVTKPVEKIPLARLYEKASTAPKWDMTTEIIARASVHRVYDACYCGVQTLLETLR